MENKNNGDMGERKDTKKQSNIVNINDSIPLPISNMILQNDKITNENNNDPNVEHSLYDKYCGFYLAKPGLIYFSDYSGKNEGTNNELRMPVFISYNDISNKFMLLLRRNDFNFIKVSNKENFEEWLNTGAAAIIHKDIIKKYLQEYLSGCEVTQSNTEQDGYESTKRISKENIFEKHLRNYPSTIPRNKETVTQLFIDRESNKANRKTNTKNNISKVGSQIYISRESNEKALNVEKYAKVLANFFKNTKGELNFGLFGAWGRGKTFLMEEVEKILQKDDYETVWFDAWKYKSQPQVWAHLFNTFHYTFFEGNFKKRKSFFNKLSYPFHYIKTVVRFNFYTNKYFLFIVGLLLSNFLLMMYVFSPNNFFFSQKTIKTLLSINNFDEIFTQLNSIKFFGSFLGISGLAALLIPYFTTFSNLKLRKYLKYLKLPNHNSNLGLQDIIGNDLKKLLLSNIKSPDAKIRKNIIIFFSGTLTIASIGLLNVTPLLFTTIPY